LETASDGAAGLDRAIAGAFDAIILDLMLPGLDGFSLCRSLRRHGNATPVLILTARGELCDKLLGFRAGADDYLGKPFEILELLARVDALIRRARGAPPVAVQAGPLRIDFLRRQVHAGPGPLPLSPREFDLLAYLADHTGIVVSREKLLEAVWGFDPGVYTRTVDVHVSSLRRKLLQLENAPRIYTVQSRGYRFETR
jgi:DNA-binding response OmpR family regulator